MYPKAKFIEVKNILKKKNFSKVKSKDETLSKFRVIERKFDVVLVNLDNPFRKYLGCIYQISVFDTSRCNSKEVSWNSLVSYIIVI